MNIPDEKVLIHLNRHVVRAASVFGLILTISLAIWVYQSGFFAAEGYFTSLLERLGFFGPLLFVLAQSLQVIYPILPGGLTLVVGQIVFGPLWGFIYNVSSILLGSVASFFLARRFGKSFVRAFVAEETYQKYYTWLNKGHRFDYLLAGAFLLPGFPDDFLCMVAGLTKMPLKRFLVIFVLFKPLTLYLYGTGGTSIVTWVFLNLPVLLENGLSSFF